MTSSREKCEDLMPWPRAKGCWEHSMGTGTAELPHGASRRSALPRPRETEFGPGSPNGGG